MKIPTILNQTAILGFMGAILLTLSAIQALTVEEVMNPQLS